MPGIITIKSSLVMENSPGKPESEVKGLIADISALMAQAEEMLNDSTSQHSGAQVELLRGRPDPRIEQLVERFRATTRRLATTLERADHVIREYPVQSVVAAFGVGVLTGSILLRRGRE